MGGETLLHDSKVVGFVTGADLGHVLEKTIASAIGRQRLQPALLHSAFGKSYPETRGPRCLYDPKGERLKA